MFNSKSSMLAPFVLLCLCAAVLSAGLGVPISEASTSAASASATRVILMVWDGAQRNHLNELLAAGQLPNLQALAAEGHKRDMVINTTNCTCASDGDNYETATGPGLAAMLTGYGFPDQGNHQNGAIFEWLVKHCPSYCPAGSPASCYRQLGANPIPAGRTIFERLKAADPGIVQGIFTGKDYYFFPFPAFVHAAPPSCCSSSGICGDGNAIEACQLSRDGTPEVTQRALAFLEQYPASPLLLLVHYHSPDDEGHLYGENSVPYSQGIIEDDAALGDVLGRLRALGIYDDTVVLVTTDHGFVEGAKGHARCTSDTKDIWIVSNRAEVLGNEAVIAKQTSIVPTIFDIFGISKDVTPAFAGESLFLPAAQ